MDVVSWEEVESRGLGARDVRRLVATGEGTRLRRGWFATRSAADDEDAHRLRAIAYKREYAGRAVISHVSALVHRELPTIDRDLSVVHLSRTVAGKSRRLGDSVFQEKKREDHLRSLGWIVVRVVWSDLKIPGRVATLVREAVARAS